ncbi:cation transporter [Thermodesulfobacterium sp. TA1]|uniref:cation diffusion facilitator family transporter n=1 Tax=Thermodesulfobacterium sp. TA1 TaxID=2234087 RepID=UPI001231C791|nr:cation diffusion facilitator family transporter [Thermodesulfobacterium sp. TA1]QER42739.1 cation transporter [Thermodesulfobacterium sp. TA1]
MHPHHHHSDHSEISGKNLFYVVVFNLVITLVEFVGGLVSGSMSLLSDAFHNLSDAMSITITYFAYKFSLKGPDEKKTFGYKRITILASLFNSVTLLVICIFLVKEAVERLINTHPIEIKTVFIIGGIGLLGNLLSLLFLKGAAKKDLNVKSAYLHILGDALSSIAVIIGALFIYFWGMVRIDPLISILIAVYIAKESLEVLLKSVNIIMQSTPTHVEPTKVVEELMKIQEIKDVHHVHLWSLDDKNHFFEGHVNLKSDLTVTQTMQVYQKIKDKLQKLGINHVTVQFEYNGCPGCEVVPKKAL